MRTIAQSPERIPAARVPCPQEGPVRPQWVNKILWSVAEEHQVPKRLIATARDRRAVAARHVAIRRLRERLLINGRPISYPTIARWFGMHHTSIMHACGGGKARTRTANLGGCV